jgi:MOSC domain-containing protein YiiM
VRPRADAVCRQLRFGNDAVVEITGLRNPCSQLNKNIAPGTRTPEIARLSLPASRLTWAGVMEACLGQDAEGNQVALDLYVGPHCGQVRKAGVMGVVLQGGEVKAGDSITMTLPAEPHVGLKPV